METRETLSGQTLKAIFELKVRKVATIRIRYNQVPHLTQVTTW